MKMNYLKPEIEAIVEIHVANVLADSNTDFGTTGEGGTPAGGDAPRWRKSQW